MKGRDFYAGNIDTNRIIINESMAKLMGKEGKIGNIISSGDYKLIITGIIKDFIYNDVYGSSAPLILINGGYAATVMSVRFKPNVNLPQALEKTGDVIKTENPGIPFEYKFSDKDFDAMFSSETLISKLAGVFAMLAIFISCLGLFGLAAYTAERVQKKLVYVKCWVHMFRVNRLLSKEFLQAGYCFACLIAFPVAWWIMNNWLQSYAYRTQYQLVDVCIGRIACYIYRIDNSKLPGNKSSNCKPCKEFENGIKN